MIDACSDAVPISGCGGRAAVAIERLERVQHPSHPQDRVAPFARAAAVRGAPARLDLEPRESLVPDRRSADRSARSRPPRRPSIA